jgi:hypothetical protein
MIFFTLSLEDAHMNRLCVRAFIRVSVRMCKLLSSYKKMYTTKSNINLVAQAATQRPRRWALIHTRDVLASRDASPIPHVVCTGLLFRAYTATKVV